MKVLLVVGARPNYMKVAPLIPELETYNIDWILVHTGQHYDYEMDRVFFENLELPNPHFYLGVGSGLHSEQTAKVMVGFEKVLLKEKPDMVILVGDVNSTLACALTASKMHYGSINNYPLIAHIEAGLRSFDRDMPEEINRIATDHLSDMLFTTCEDANGNLEREGISKDKIFFVGNVMIDSLFKYKERAGDSDILKRLSLFRNSYGLLTLHRPENVDDKERLGEILDALLEVQKRIRIVFPVHPRTEKALKRFEIWKRLEKSGMGLLKPLGYIDFLKLEMKAEFVLTDSGGVQEETTVLGIPCLTLRRNTERPVTVYEGTNTVIGTDRDRIIGEIDNVLKGDYKKGRIPKYWDGKAAKRIVEVMEIQRETTKSEG